MLNQNNPVKPDKMSGNFNPWYQFQLRLNQNQPEKTKIIFPQDPQTDSVGQTIVKYIEQAGLIRQESFLPVNVIYFARNDQINLQALIKLANKFEPKGAELINEHTGGISSKKQPAIANQELNSLEQELKTLEQESAIAERELNSLEQELSSLKRRLNLE